MAEVVARSRARPPAAITKCLHRVRVQFTSEVADWHAASVRVMGDRTVANALQCGQQRAMPRLATQNYA